MLAGDMKRLKERVDTSCLRAVEIESARGRSTRPDSGNLLSQVATSSGTASVGLSPSGYCCRYFFHKEKGEKLDTKVEQKITQRPKPPPPETNVVADLQEQQREQMEAAVSTMASQLKHHTSQIHSQLRGQTEHLLSDMETVAERNVEAVTIT
jgi:hypothetical protein